jgi:hypothetical protein
MRGWLFGFAGKLSCGSVCLPGDLLQALDYGAVALAVTAPVALALCAAAPADSGARRSAVAGAMLCWLGLVFPSVLPMAAELFDWPEGLWWFWAICGVTTCAVDVAAPALLARAACRLFPSSTTRGHRRAVAAVRATMAMRALYYLARIGAPHPESVATVVGTAVDLLHVLSDALLAWLVISAAKPMAAARDEKRAEEADEGRLAAWHAGREGIDPIALWKKAQKPALMAAAFAVAGTVVWKEEPVLFDLLLRLEQHDSFLYFRRATATLLRCLTATLFAVVAPSCLSALEGVARALEARDLVARTQAAFGLSMAAGFLGCILQLRSPSFDLLVVLLLPLALAAPAFAAWAVVGVVREVRTRWSSPQMTAYRGVVPRK